VMIRGKTISIKNIIGFICDGDVTTVNVHCLLGIL